MRFRFVLRDLAAFVALAVPVAAHAQIFRAYLAIDGSDANPCTVQAPCRLLPAALAAVASGGEIWMLDSANYNTAQVEITKSVTILAVPGAVGSVVGMAGFSAIRVNGAGAMVALRNLSFRPFSGQSQAAVSMVLGAGLRLENCIVLGDATNRFQSGILAEGPVSAEILVSGSDISARLYGVDLRSSSAQPYRLRLIDTVVIASMGLRILQASQVTVDNVRLLNSADGLAVGIWIDASAAPIQAHISRSTITGFAAGILAQADSGAYASVSVTDSEISHNLTGMQTGGTNTSIALSGNRVVHNNVGASVGAGTAVYTSGTNYFAYNAGDGSPLAGPAGLK